MNQKTEPLIKGGQGRSAEDVGNSAVVIAWVLGVSLPLLVVAIIITGVGS